MHVRGTETSAARKKALRQQERELLLIDAAHETLGERGYQGFTIEAVLARSGLARRAFYECFESKDALLLAVFARSLGEGAKYFAAEADAAPSRSRSRALETILRDLVLNSFNDVPPGSANRSIAFSYEHHKLATSHPRELDAALEPLLGTLARVIAEGIDTGEFAAVDARAYARFIYNLVSTTIHSELLSGAGSAQTASHAELADRLCRFCFGALRQT